MTEITDAEVERTAASKLHPGQSRALRRIVTAGDEGATISEWDWRLADRLCELGLIERFNARWRTDRYVATDLGRRVAASLSRSSREG